MAARRPGCNHNKGKNGHMAYARLLRTAAALSLALLVARTAGAAPAPPGALPPISDPPSGEYRPGKFVWIDLVTADVAGARKFYGGLLGWAFADLGSGAREYTLAYAAGYPVAGMVARAPVKGQERQSRWVAYVSVTDVAAAAKQVAGKGGRVLIPPRAVPGRGEMALLADPDGAPFGVVRSSSGDPPDFLPEPGDWIWALYQSPDATSAAAFYQDLAGYDVVPDGRFPKTPHYILAAGGYARASLAGIPAERLGLRPDWLYFIRVRDAKASLARAVELGGKVLVAADPALLDGRIAVVVDPGGAPFGLMEWNEDAGEGN